MSHPPPLRSRPNLKLGLTKLTGSPRHSNHSSPPGDPLFNPYPSPEDTPLAKTPYTPFSSAGLRAPHPIRVHGFVSTRYGSRHWYESYTWYQTKRIFASKPILLFIMVIALILWWFNGGSDELDVVKLGAAGFGREYLHERKMYEYQFYPATNPKIRVSLSMIFHLCLLTVTSTLGGGHLHRTDCAKMELFQVSDPREVRSIYGGLSGL